LKARKSWSTSLRLTVENANYEIFRRTTLRQNCWCWGDVLGVAGGSNEEVLGLCSHNQGTRHQAPRSRHKKGGNASWIDAIETAMALESSGLMEMFKSRYNYDTTDPPPCIISAIPLHLPKDMQDRSEYRRWRCSTVDENNDSQVRGWNASDLKIYCRKGSGVQSSASGRR
jgi:hypothetical protein